MENKILYKGDCPNLGDFEKVQENLERAIKIQEDYWKWESEQPFEPIKYYERSLN